MNVRRRDAGLSLVELVIAMAVMLIALVALTVSITSATQVTDSSRERAVAYELAKSKIEEMRNFTYSGSYDKLFYYYSQTANANVYALVPNPLNTAQLIPNPLLPDPLGLNPVMKSGVQQPIMTITFPVDKTGVLTESPADPTFAARFGMPKDLNRNGTTTDSGSALYNSAGGAPPATGYTILPVLVTVTWKSVGQKSSYVELATMIAAK